MFPAQQGFHREDVTGLDADLRLIDELEFVPFESSFEVSDQCQPFLGGLAVFGPVMLDPIATAVLGPVHGGSGLHHDIAGRTAVLRIRGDADARRDPDHVRA